MGKLWALPRWRWLLVPVLFGTVFIICIEGVLRLVDAESVHWVRSFRESQGLNGTILAVGFITVVSYTLGLFAVISKYRYGAIPNPSFMLTRPTLTEKTDTFEYNSTLIADTPFALTKLKVKAVSENLYRVMLGAPDQMIHSGGGDGGTTDNGKKWFSEELQAVSGQLIVKVITKKREPVEVAVLVGGDKVVVSEVFRPQKP